MDGLVAPEHRRAARRLRALVAAYESKRDLVTLGAYAKGTDREVDDRDRRGFRASKPFSGRSWTRRATVPRPLAALVGALA